MGRWGRSDLPCAPFSEETGHRTRGVKGRDGARIRCSLGKVGERDSLTQETTRAKAQGGGNRGADKARQSEKYRRIQSISCLGGVGGTEGRPQGGGWTGGGL